MSTDGGPPASSPESSFPDEQSLDSPEIFYKVFEFAPDAILLVSSEGRIRKVNSQAERMFGYTRSELAGQLIELLIPQRLVERHVQYRSTYMAHPHTRPMGVGQELFGLRKDGGEFPVDIMLSPLDTEDGTLVLGIVRDATERKRIEGIAAAAREMYFKEVHHRVKNNLQVISSLLNLQATYTDDVRTLSILKESQTRVKSIALIHEKLYRSPDLVRLDFGQYVRELSAELFRTYARDQGSVQLRTEVEDVSLAIDTAIPCGLIIHELVSNALKHAFAPGSSGEVFIGLSIEETDAFVLVVSDNGGGLPADFSLESISTLGLQLVSDLTRQIDGKLTIDSNGHTTFRIRFKEVHYRERG